MDSCRIADSDLEGIRSLLQEGIQIAGECKADMERIQIRIKRTLDILDRIERKEIEHAGKHRSNIDRGTSTDHSNPGSGASSGHGTR
jgi:hypothetical protein